MPDHRLFSAGERGLGLSIPRLIFAFVGAPVLWATHLVTSYFVLTMDCITGWDGAGWTIAVLTALFAAGALAAGWTALGIRRELARGDAVDPRDWLGFLTVIGIGAAPLFALVIVATGVAPAFTSLCA